MIATLTCPQSLSLIRKIFYCIISVWKSFFNTIHRLIFLQSIRLIRLRSKHLPKIRQKSSRSLKLLPLIKIQNRMFSHFWFKRLSSSPSSYSYKTPSRSKLKIETWSSAPLSSCCNLTAKMILIRTLIYSIANIPIKSKNTLFQLHLWSIRIKLFPIIKQLLNKLSKPLFLLLIQIIIGMKSLSIIISLYRFQKF